MSIATMPMHLEHLERQEPGVHSSAVLAILVHVLLFAVLFSACAGSRARPTR